MVKRHDIFITNNQKTVKITPEIRKLIKTAITEALAYENFDSKAEVSVTITDNERIHELNFKHRGVDRPTDVLSFPMYEDDEDMDISREAAVLGDIVISAEKALEQAEEYGHSPEREIAFLCVHSVLHLLGYDHETSEDDERDMFRRQEEILNKIGLGKQ